MIKPALAKSLESIIGRDHITVEPSLMIDGLKPSVVVKPGSTEEVVGCLRACSESDAAIVPAGLMAWLESGNPLRRADVVLSLERLARIIDYSPPDLTAVVEAGLTIGEFNAAAMAENQWLPLDPPGSPTASLGAIAACASSGPLRLGFGTPRDYVIGLRLAHIDGSESKAGGRVVKNVAGYDMNKLYVGSHGTLAVITELTVKLRPVPESDRTVLVTSRNQKSLVEIGNELLASEAQPASVFFTTGIKYSGLVVRFLDNEQAVKHQTALLAELVQSRGDALTVGGDEASQVWRAIANCDQVSGNSLTLSVPLSSTSQLLDKLLSETDRVVVADLGTGIIRVGLNTDDEKMIDITRRLRAEAFARGGSLFVERASAAVRREADAWGEIGPTGSLMRSIKERFDPKSLMNPGRFVSGI
ncbi:MAG TPA: FAD-binding oxidoreductase [Blastocatellia bacterium]|nr:FAD-binding oxidoreductase [Blastocatellia bacterium]